jgi:hypothetical protein
VDPCFDHQTFGVHQQMSLPAPDLLAAVEASLLASDACGFHRLAIDDSGAGLGFSPEPHPQTFAHRVVQSLPGTIQAPPPEVVEHCLPGRELAREHAPLAAGFRDAEDGVEHRTRTVHTGTPAGFGCREVRLQQRPFGIGQVGGVFPALHGRQRSQHADPRCLRHTAEARPATKRTLAVGSGRC